MKIHEYQGKAILKDYGVPVPRGIVARTPEEAETAAKELATDVVVVKAQIHAGGRGKGGGVRLARSPDEARQHAEAMLGMMLKTPQTGPEGQEVRKVYIEEGCRIARELYLGMTLDREAGRLAVMASIEGGVDIEEVAKRHPEKILREWIDPLIGLMPYQARRLAFGLGRTGEVVVSRREGETVLGRGAEAGVRIDLGRVSRRHARIVVDGARAVLEDLGSKNGTFLRGERLLAPAELADGDEIAVGTALLLFRAADGDATTETGTAR